MYPSEMPAVGTMPRIVAAHIQPVRAKLGDTLDFLSAFMVDDDNIMQADSPERLQCHYQLPFLERRQHTYTHYPPDV